MTNTIHVCVPRRLAVARCVQRCRVCKCLRRCVAILHEWYDPDMTCCACGNDPRGTRRHNLRTLDGKSASARKIKWAIEDWKRGSNWKRACDIAYSKR